MTQLIFMRLPQFPPEDNASASFSTVGLSLKKREKTTKKKSLTSVNSKYLQLKNFVIGLGEGLGSIRILKICAWFFKLYHTVIILPIAGGRGSYWSLHTVYIQTVNAVVFIWQLCGDGGLSVVSVSS